MKTCLFVLLSALFQLCVCDYAFYKPKPQPSNFTSWDYIVYSQRWAITGCSQWLQRSSKNTCDLPKDTNHWIVHGVWPTKTGTKGPFFCNSALHFDLDQINAMIKELQEFWPNIEANTKPTSFWKHEWSKHGSCASFLPQLNSVTNYFKRGLQWNQDYNIFEILSSAGITPNANGYNITEIFNAVKTKLRKVPAIDCVIDGKTKKSLISEVRICFDKNLDLIDCSRPDALGDDLVTNCNLQKNVMYLAEVPNYTIANMFDYDFENSNEVNTRECLDNYYYQADLLKFYNVVKFLMWFTL